MSSTPLTRFVAMVVIAMAIVLSALAVHAMHKTPAQLPGSEILTPIWPGGVLS